MGTNVQLLAATIFTIFLVGIVAIAIFIWYKAKKEEDGKLIKQKLYKIRSGYFVVLLTTLVVLLGFTLNTLPYFESNGGKDSKPADFTVSAVGIQWAWMITEGTIEENGLEFAGQFDLVYPVHKLIEFQVTATDVNHGFGIYDEDGRLLVQTQAMPGYVNRLRYTFDKPGTYHIICMEYCGAAHQVMMSKIEVQ
ncbi:MAG: hypothetical protein WC967_15595 [Balneolaceae bacterium]